METAFKCLPLGEDNFLGLMTSLAAPWPEQNPNKQKGNERSSAISLKKKPQQNTSGTVPGHVQLDAKRLLLHKAGTSGYKNRPKHEGNFIPKNSVMRMRASKQLEAPLVLPDCASQASVIVFIIWMKQERARGLRAAYTKRGDANRPPPL